MPQKWKKMYEEIKRVLDKFPKYHILLADFNVMVAKKDISKQAVGNDCLHETSIDSEVGQTNFAISKNLTVKSTMFPHHKINI
jgi:hypothetical protein